LNEERRKDEKTKPLRKKDRKLLYQI